jgi:hypothetical protein
LIHDAMENPTAIPALLHHSIRRTLAMPGRPSKQRLLGPIGVQQGRIGDEQAYQPPDIGAVT